MIEPEDGLNVKEIRRLPGRSRREMKVLKLSQEGNITIGQVGKPHGVKGEVKVIPLTDDIRRFRRLRYVIIKGREFKVEFVKLQADRAILKLEGIQDPEGLISLKDAYVEVRSEDAVRKKRDEYFIDELKGLEVFDTESKALGSIYDVIQTGANDVYWIQEPEQLLIPAMKNIVVEVSLEKNRVIIRPTREWNYED